MTNPVRRYSFVQVDVFSARPLEGNPLAVFPQAAGLSDAEMQSIAREMNLSETTYVLRRDPAIERENGLKVRIFTVSEELPFAGHPTLGTAFVLRNDSRASEVVLDLKAGKVPVRFENSTPTFGEMRQIDPEFGRVHDREVVANSSGFSVSDFDPELPIQTVSTGVPFTIVPLRSLSAARRLHLDWGRASEYLEKTGGRFFYFVTRETVDSSAKLHARMIFGGGEDPATGSAAGCAAAWMVANGLLAPGEQALIEQGIEAQRPSRIFVRADKQDDQIVNVRVGGNTVEVLRGEIILP
jgi:trans-2,3-dihydro-3-hydroxyanthranilate isomerase